MAIIGIDLGTSNSLISHWQDGKAHLIENNLGAVLTPSIVGLDDNNRVIVGEVAKHRLITHPQKTISEFKRYMGTNKIFSLGNKEFRAEELSALVIKSLVADAESKLGDKIESAIISVPAYFSDAQRKATRDAGRLAGIEVERLINEPTAAAIAYGLHESEQDTTFLVFDIGGGTFDVSILELFEGVMQVNSTAGDNRLGGEDFLEVIVEHVILHNGLKRSKLSNKDRAIIRANCEAAKKALTNDQSVTIKFRLGNKSINQELDRQTFEKICSDLFRRLRMPLERALKDASLYGEDLDAVILVGGASRMPVIRSMVSKMLGKIPHSHINPDEIVAQGAASQAALVAGDKSLSEVILTDVAPYTLGVGVVNESGFYESGEIFHPIIDRNSPVPISRMDNLVTAKDFQTTIDLSIYQGEARLVRDNIKLGELSLNVPRARRGEESVEIRLTYDISGLLEVDAQVKSTGVKEKVTIEGNPGTLTETELKQRLAELEKLKIHPREEEANALLIARGERLYELSIGETRDYISGLLTQFEQILHKQIKQEIEPAATELNKIFEQIEQNSPLH
ncbi:MAG: molecular chaperone HscC [Agarilytica sp.]